MTDADWEKLKQDLEDEKIVIFTKKQADNLLKLERYTATLELMAKEKEAYALMKTSLRNTAVLITALSTVVFLGWEKFVALIKLAAK